MAPAQFTYDAAQRKERWEKIPAEKRAELVCKLKHLFRVHRTLTISELRPLMGMPKWMIFMTLAPLLDSSHVYALAYDKNGCPTKLIHWEDFAEGESTG